MIGQTGVTKLVIGGLVAAILLGALGPTMMDNLETFRNDSNVTGTATDTIVGLIPLFLVLAIAIGYFVRKVRM